MKLWSARDGTLLRSFAETADVSSVAFSPDGTRVLSASSDRKVKLWDVSTSDLIRAYEHPGEYVTSVTFSHDGTRIAASQGQRAFLWDTESGQLLREFAPTGDVGSASFSPDGARLLLGSWMKGSYLKLTLWNAEDGSLLRNFATRPAAVVPSVAFSPDGKRFLSGSNDKTVKLWELSTSGARIFKVKANENSPVAFLRDGTAFLAARDPETAILWDIARARETYVFKLTGSDRAVRMRASGTVTLLAPSFDGTRILAGGTFYLTGTYENPYFPVPSPAMNLWDVKTGTVLRKFDFGDVRNAFGSSLQSIAPSLSLLKISTGLREAGDFHEPAVPSRSW